MAENLDMERRVTRLEARIDGHEELCGERWAQLRDRVGDMTRGMKRLEWLLYGGAITALGVLVKTFWLDKVN